MNRPLWDQTIFHEVPNQLKDITPMTNEPWLRDRMLYDEIDLQQRAAMKGLPPPPFGSNQLLLQNMEFMGLLLRVCLCQTAQQSSTSS